MFRISCKNGGTPKQAAGIVKDMTAVKGVKIRSLTMYVEFKNRDGEFVQLPDCICSGRQSVIDFPSGASPKSVEVRLNGLIKKNGIEMSSVVFCFYMTNNSGRLCLLCNDVGLEFHGLELESIGEGVLAKFFADAPDFRFMSNQEMVLREKAAKNICKNLKSKKGVQEFNLFTQKGDLFMGEFIKKNKKWMLKKQVPFPRDMFQGILFECMVDEGVAISDKLEKALAKKSSPSIIKKLEELEAEMSRIFLSVFPAAEKFMKNA